MAKNKSNLRRFVKLFENEEGINDVILTYFDNEDTSKINLNGTIYYILQDWEVEDKLIEAAEIEAYDFIHNIEDEYPEIASILSSNISAVMLDKPFEDNFDKLEGFEFIEADDKIFVYTKK
jgi:hypothetical protein